MFIRSSGKGWYASFGLAALALLMLLTPASAQAATGAMSADEYRAWVMLQPDGATTRAQFDALSSADQSAFLSLVTNTSVIGEANAAVWGTSARKLANGRVTVSAPRTSVTYAPAALVASSAQPGAVTTLAASGTWTVSAWRSVGILGVDVMKITTWMTYGYSGSTVTKAYEAGNRHTNYIPVNYVTGVTRTPYVSGNLARVSTDWSVQTCVVIKPLCVTQSNTQRITGSANGTVTQSMD